MRHNCKSPGGEALPAWLMLAGLQLPMEARLLPSGVPPPPCANTMSESARSSLLNAC